MAYIFASESVSEGHPDKVCDLISDAILDAHLAKDPFARVAAETLVTVNKIVLAGELRSQYPLSSTDIDQVVRSCVRSIGYEQEGFHWKNVEIENLLHEQSADIALGVDSSDQKEEGAGDQGLMFGYACRETESLMPAPLYYAHKILHRLSEFRRAHPEAGLEPDAKSQVVVRYEKGAPVGLSSVVVSSQHKDFLSQKDVRSLITPLLLEVLPPEWQVSSEHLYVNPTGRFVIGGPKGDTGLTGRKIIVDTYGGAAPHGGGAFSGKDPTKVDRSAAYMARYLAKNIVKAGLADRCLLQLSYAIGLSKPLSLYIDLFQTGKVSSELLAQKIGELVDLSPAGIRQHLQLNRPIYHRTASYGHFGREPQEDGGFSWEKEDLVEKLQALFL